MTDADPLTATLDLGGVALRQHDEPYPFDYRPYRHQLRLDELIRGEEGFVAVDDAPTGGGKTSAWLAPALDTRLDTIAVYPTNALVEDQTRQVRTAADAVDHDVRVMTVTSDKLGRQRAALGGRSNGDTLNRWYRKERRSGDQVILLTNPDIFVMMARGLYANPNRVYRQIPLAVVDEFHRAGRKEQNTLRYILDELYERDNARLHKIAFLSATPDDRQERRFECAMAAEYHRVTTDGEDERRAFWTPDEVGSDWRSVMPPVELDVRSAPTFGTADRVLEDDGEELRGFCRERPDEPGGDRVAVILDGIHEVDRVFSHLDDALDRRVERIDGFHGERKAEKLESFDVLVSNSAVEVGIDFDIDRLLFAGHNRAAFLQRLGRLRGSKAISCEARGYAPRDVVRSIEADERTNGGPLSRVELDELLEDVYPEPRRPTSFGWRYSTLEASEHLTDRIRNAPSEEEERIARAGRARVQRHFLEGTDVGLGSADLERMKEAIDWRILTRLQWYRGDSIQALVYDRTVETVRTYDVFYLLRHGDVQFLPEATFEQMIPDDQAETLDRMKRYVDGFCTYDGTIGTTEDGHGRSVSFAGSDLLGWIETTDHHSNRTPRVVNEIRLRVEAPDGGTSDVGVEHLNQRLQTRRDRLGDDAGVLCYPVSMCPNAAKQQYDLGEFFFLYPVASHGRQEALALGTDALYLHCLVEEDQADQGGLIGL